jgi:predicted anti-sigma-YlaC factor YlaD
VSKEEKIMNNTVGGKILCDLLRKVMSEHPDNCTSCRGYYPGAFERITSMPEWATIMQAMEDEEDRHLIDEDGRRAIAEAG